MHIYANIELAGIKADIISSCAGRLHKQNTYIFEIVRKNVLHNYAFTSILKTCIDVELITI